MNIVKRFTSNTCFCAIAIYSCILGWIGNASAVEYEAENLTISGASPSASAIYNQTGFSNNAYVHFTGANPPTSPGTYYVELTTPSIAAGTYTLSYTHKANTSRGKFQVSVDGTNYGVLGDQYAASAATSPVTISVENLSFTTAGTHKIRWTTNSKNNASSGYGISIDKVILTPVGGTNYSLTISAVNGTVALSPAGGSYTAGTQVTLTATPAPGYQWSSWSGALSGNQNPTTITMNSNYSIVAIFATTSSFTSGDMAYFNGSNWMAIPKGTPGQMLTENASQIPTWTDFPGTVTDIDGNIYKTIIINNQEWTLTNIRTTKYRDGTPIPNVTGGTAWAALSTGAYCFYNNTTDIAEQKKWGALYNWYAATDPRNLAPTGWRVPSDEDWSNLENYLIACGYNYDGTTMNNKIAKSMAIGIWTSSDEVGSVGNNIGIKNLSGFAGLPVGERNYYSGSFLGQGNYAMWWSTNELDASSAWNRYLYYSQTSLTREAWFKKFGHSIRLVRNLN